MKTLYKNLLFFAVLILFSAFYNYHNIAFKRPQSIHKWRQSDCASIALNYYQNGMNFFTPETHNLTSDNGTTSKCCTSEIPVLYYSVAVLYEIFGYNDSIYRIFNTLIFFLGLFYLFKTFEYLLKDTFWPIVLTMLVFTSPVLVYYGNNYLSNSSALAFSFVGWYYFVRFTSEKQSGLFYKSMLFFLIASALKVSALFSFFAIVGLFLFEQIGLTKPEDDKKLFYAPVRFFLVMLSVFVIVVGWIIYADHYNKLHDTTYFSTTIFPIWDLSKTEIYEIINKVRQLWFKLYFHPTVFALIGVCFAFIMLKFNKNRKVFTYSILIILAEAIVYIALQFWTFHDHDYYTIDLYILLVLILLSAFDLLSRHFRTILSSLWIKIAFTGFLLFNLYYAHNKTEFRYNSWMNDYEETKDFYSITPYLRSIGITQNDTVIAIPGGSHVSLYLMNQKGWTEYTDARFNRGEKVKYNQDSTGIQKSINNGAKYLIINGVEEIYKKPYLQNFCTDLSGHYNNILIFNLVNRNRNFNLQTRKIKSEYFCNTENLTNGGTHFINIYDSTLFEFGSSQSNDFAYSGQYSSRLNAENPYGMTIRLKDLKPGESFVVSAWRKATSNAKGILIASSAPTAYYYKHYTIDSTAADGWEKMSMEFFIPAKVKGQELTIYAFNPEVEPVYFDDFNITRYHSIYEELNRVKH